MDSSSQDQQISYESTGSTSSTPNSGEVSNNLSSDHAHVMAAETTPNSISYWPHTSSSLPSMNFSKEMVNCSAIQAHDRGQLHAVDGPKNSNADRGSGLGENQAGSKCAEASQTFVDGTTSTLSGQPTKTLHHNLPPIVGITSSHGCRTAREIQKQSHTNFTEAAQKPTPGHFECEAARVESRSEEKVTRSDDNESVENKYLSVSGRNREAEKNKVNSIQKCDKNIMGINTASLDRVKADNSESAFSVPVTHQKPASAPRTSTQFVNATGATSSDGSQGESLPQNVNSGSQLSTGSVCTSNLPAPARSPHFMAPTSVAVSMSSGNVRSATPLETSRLLSSPHSNLVVPVSTNHAVPSCHSKMSSYDEGSRSSPFIQPVELPSYSSPQHLNTSLPSHPNSHSAVPPINIPLTCSTTSSAHSDSARPREVIQEERSFGDLSSQNSVSQKPLSHSNHSVTNPSSHQEQDRPMDPHCSRNEFDLALSKSYSQQYSHVLHQERQQPNNHHHYHHGQQQQQQQHHHHHHHHHHQQQQPQPQHSVTYSENNKQSMDPHSKAEHFSNLLPTTKELYRPPGAMSYANNFKQAKVNGKESDKFCDVQYKYQINSASSNFKRGFHGVGSSQNDVKVQQEPVNSARSEIFHKDFSKELEMTKVNNSAPVLGNGTWNKSESNPEFGSKIAYLNSQNVNKNVNKVNGSDYYGRRTIDIGYQDLDKSGFRKTSEGLGTLSNIGTDNKKIGNISSVKESNSVRHRFPPVPQSNYDLNRHIYDSMTGRNTTTHPPPLTRPPEKSDEEFGYSNDQNPVAQMSNNKIQSSYRDNADQDRARKFDEASLIQQMEFSAAGKNSGRSIPGHNQVYVENRSYLGKKSVGQVPSNAIPPSHIQSGETRLPLSSTVNDHLKNINPGLHTGHPTILTSYQNVVPERNRSIPIIQNPSIFPQKLAQDESDLVSKRLLEDKTKVHVSQFNCVQNAQALIPSAQLKGKILPSTAVSSRPKRESPLDLSVKTVRQSADSTAKEDDGELHVQSFRNLLHGNQSFHSETRFPATQYADASARAPKVDFTPNFSGFHSENPRPTTPLHKTEASMLPPVESFKKFTGRGVSASATQSSKIKNEFSSSKYISSSHANPPKAQSAVIDQSGRYAQVDHLKMEAQKRLSCDMFRNHSSQAKIQKVDTWKLAFDQQIEQRLNSARTFHQKADPTLNGLDRSKPSDASLQHSLNCESSRQSSCSSHYRTPNVFPQPPIQTSVSPYNPAYTQQPQCQPATPQTPKEKTEQRESLGLSADPEQIIKQISKGVMPDHKLLQDKTVLSILRSSLEEKEAKLMQLREAARRKEKYKEFMLSESGRKHFPPHEQTPKNQSSGKKNLPPFGALPLERISIPPTFPNHKLGLHGPVDAIKAEVEPVQKYYSPEVTNDPEKSGIPSTDPSPQDDAQGPPADLDGLAAFLAARIRTKGELKQVGPTLDSLRAPSNLPMKNHSGIVTSSIESAERKHISNAISSGSPPKLIRESRLLPPSRRRLFNHVEEEMPTTSGGQASEYSCLPSRDPNGIRSSSETSVFDFRESDSEGEMPVLERQTLEEMRRDRKTFGSKQNVSTTTPDDTVEVLKPDVIAELDKSHPDPFWDTAFDMFVEQLEKRPPKRSVRKRKGCSRIPFAGSETDESEKVSFDDDIKSNKVDLRIDEGEKNDENAKKCEKVFEVKKEPEDNIKTEGVPEKHVKLSSSRLRVYRDEMMRTNNHLDEVKVEKECEKLSKYSDKTRKDHEKDTEKQKCRKVANKKKSQVGMRTRGKSKVTKKESEITNSDSDSEEKDFRSESEYTVEDDDDSLSLSGLESESTDSETNQLSSNSNYSSFDESEGVSRKRVKMQTRLQTRKSRQRQVRGTGMKLRSKPATVASVTSKPVKKKKKRKEEYYSASKKKKPFFGDGSDFRPGWEEECYKFKQQLRMPEKLISISRPPKRSSVSLPDLDPYRNSPSLDSSDVSMNKKIENGKNQMESDESDPDVNKKKSKNQAVSSTAPNNHSSLLKSRNGKKTQSNSILNMLVNKYGKETRKKQKELKATMERKSPRVLPKATNKPELLPTPSLGIGKENVLKDKKRTKDSIKKKTEECESVYLGYFRKKTVNNFKEAFKHKVGMFPQEFSPVILKSRTRTQTRDLKKRATLVEVFGEDRPASAPPLSREDDASTDQEKTENPSDKKKKKPKIAKVCGGVVTRGRGKLTRSGRPGLRSTAMLRSSKAVQISKRHLNSGRKRNMELLRIRAIASKKFSYLVASSETSNQLPMTKKRLKLRSVRRKFRSGFDYIRKKKKLKKDGDSADGSVKEKRLFSRPTSESVEDIQNEIKNWVINKGLGETILHRAARLGYTDVAAYCLEKMECSPSPRDNAGYTPLHEACSRGHLEIAKLLLMYGASVSESAKGGIRPLHEAAENGFTELIRLLLSFGADPLLETYTGHTALSLVTDEEARRLIQHHLADVQGNVAPVWTFQGPSSLFDPIDSGYDPLHEPPSPDPTASDYEFEVSQTMLPPLYRLTSDRDSDRHWILIKDIMSHTRIKSKDVLLKHLGSSSIREMKLSDFHDQGKCCTLFQFDKPPPKTSKVVLVPYDDKVRQLLGVEKIVV